MADQLYELRIHCKRKDQYDRVSDILGIAPSESGSTYWRYEVAEAERSPNFNFVDHFLGVLAGRFEQLESIKIAREDISVWLLYAYDDQCNLEFSPFELEKLGANGIHLCVSCWNNN